MQGVEKTIVSKMLEKGSSRRCFAVDRHAGVVRNTWLVNKSSVRCLLTGMNKNLGLFTSVQ